MDGGDDVPAEDAHPHGKVDEANDGGVCALGVDVTENIVGGRVHDKDLRDRGIERKGEGEIAKRLSSCI